MNESINFFFFLRYVFTYFHLFFSCIHLACFLFISFLHYFLIAGLIWLITTPSFPLYSRFFSLLFFFLHQSTLPFPLCFIFSRVCLAFLFHSISFCRNRLCVRNKTRRKGPQNTNILYENMSASLLIYVAMHFHCPLCKGAFVTKVVWITTVAIKITFEEPISTTLERCKISTGKTEHYDWRREQMIISVTVQ